MKRNIYVILLILVLVAVCVLEEILLQSTCATLQGYSNELTVLFSQHKDELNSNAVTSKFEQTKLYWDKQKRLITYFTNYDKIRSIDESFVKLEEALDENDKSLALENLSIIKSTADSLHYFMGFNINNLF